MDFEIPRAKLGNYFHGNLIMKNDELMSFTFPSAIQSETFYLQLMTFNDTTMKYSFANALALNNTYKETGYFKQYVISPVLAEGYYRIKAGSYYSTSLIQIKDMTDVFSEYSELVDNTGDSFIDNISDSFTQPN